MEEQEFARRQRRARVVHDWLAGGSVAEVARTHGLTPGGVRYILDTTPGARGQREVRDAQLEQARVEELRSTLGAWSRQHPGVPLSVAGEQHGLKVQQVADLLGERAQFHPARRSGTVARYSDEEMLAGVRAHVAATGDRRADSYRRVAKEQGWALLDALLWRFGTWRQVLDAVERAAITGEVEAAHHSPLTPGIVDLLHQCRARGMRVAMVSNNPGVCIAAFLQLHHLEHLVSQVQGRTACHPEWMKPHPRVLQLALADTPTAEALMLGDSTSDMIAATTLGIPAIGLADTPTKATLLRDAGASAIITAMTDLT